MQSQTHRRSPLLRLLTPLVAAAVLVGTAACTGTADETGGEDQTHSITIPVLSWQGGLDPQGLEGGYPGFVSLSIFDTLLRLGNDGLQPNAAESWEYSDDALTLTLKLRDGMTFSSGDPVDAEAVKFTLERTIASGDIRSNDLRAVESVEAPDELTVVLNLSEPDGGLLDRLANVAGVIGDPATLDDENTSIDPVGSGPYTLKIDATTPGSAYVLERRDDYWNAEAFDWDTVTIKVIADRQAQFNAMQAGEVSVGTVSADQIPAIEASGFSVSEIQGSSLAGVAIRDRAGEVVPALADVRVRQAINMAFDREAFVSGLLGGLGSPAQQIFSPSSDGYVDDLEGYDHDVDAAKELMAEAGYADGFDVVMPSTFISTPFEPGISQAMQDIGITVSWNPVPPQNYGEALTSTDYPMFFFVDGSATTFNQMYVQFGDGGALNPYGSSEDIAAMVDEVSATVDPDERAELYQEFSKTVSEEALAAPLMHINATWAAAPGYKLLRVSGGTDPYLVNMFGIAE